MLIAFHKPYDVLSQFSKEIPSHRTLADFGFPAGVYGIGRLDRDSEGLLLLSDEAHWTERLLNPQRAHPRTYWVQVEGGPQDGALSSLRQGLQLKDGPTKPCVARLLERGQAEATLPPRHPPVRFRQSIPTRWLELTLTEGRNRQVRRMTAAVGHPTLRLVRVAIGGLRLLDLGLAGGQWVEVDRESQSSLMRAP